MKKQYILLSLLVGISFILVACTGGGAVGTETLGAPLSTEPLMTEPVEPLTTLPAVETPMATAAESSPTAEATQADLGTQEIPGTGTIDPGLISSLLDFGVYSDEDTEIGQTMDFVLDIKTGQFTYLVVQNADGDLVPVPWELVTILTATAEAASSTGGPQNDFRLSVDQATFESAPIFAQGEFPDTQEADWDAEIQAYWQEYLPEETPSP